MKDVFWEGQVTQCGLAVEHSEGRDGRKSLEGWLETVFQCVVSFECLFLKRGRIIEGLQWQRIVVIFVF